MPNCRFGNGSRVASSTANSRFGGSGACSSVARALTGEHGLDPAAYPWSPEPQRGVAFLGRLAPEKGPHVAIDVARAAGVPIELGGQAHEVARAYFERERPHRIEDHERYREETAAGDR